MNYCSFDLDFFNDPENRRRFEEAVNQAGKKHANTTIEKTKAFVLKRVRECHYFNNLVNMESIIGQAVREFKDQEFINELRIYSDDLKIKNFMNSLGNQAEGFQLFMLKFREKLIKDIKAEIATKKDEAETP